MTKTNWIQVLKAFYNTEDGRFIQIDRSHTIHNSHPLVEETDLGSNQVKNALRYLINDADLVDGGVSPIDPDSERMMYRLNKRGFDVAHDIEMDNRTHSLNGLTAGFTLILAVGTILQSARLITQYSSLSGAVVSIVLIFLAFLVALMIRYPQKWADSIFSH